MACSSNYKPFRTRPCFDDLSKNKLIYIYIFILFKKHRSFYIGMSLSHMVV
jgi:hypothetical protein